MHVLISAVGSAGDVLPFVAIGQVLRARGHAVTLAAAEGFRGRVEAAGIEFVTAMAQAEVDAVLRDADVWKPQRGFAALWGHLGKTLPSNFALLDGLARPDTVLVASTLSMAARLVQETRGLPLASVHLAPSVFFSATDPAVRGGVAGLRALPAWAVRGVLGLVEDRLLDPLIAADLDPARASLGLPRVRRVMSRWLHSPDLVVCAFPAWFAPPQADWPARSVCTGFPRLDTPSGSVLSPALEAFLHDRAALAFTPGTSMAHGRGFFARALAASRALGRRAVFVTPYRDQLPVDLPAFVHHEAEVPFDLLAPRVAAFVHHGGIGTCAQALAAGAPQLVVPFSFDQPDNARLLERLGVAERVAPNSSANAWVRALDTLLHCPRVAVACRDMAARMAAERPAAEQIADCVEALARVA
jgi:rhamnosyltransferase subunit B